MGGPLTNLGPGRNGAPLGKRIPTSLGRTVDYSGLLSSVCVFRGGCAEVLVMISVSFCLLRRNRNNPVDSGQRPDTTDVIDRHDNAKQRVAAFFQHRVATSSRTSSPPPPSVWCSRTWM